MPVRNFRSRLGLEQLEGRCTPSAMLDDPRALIPADSAASQAARISNPAVATDVRATRQHVVPIQMAYQCFADVSTGTLSASGVATGLGNWTSQGRLDKVDVNRAADRATIWGKTTIVTANGDKLFVSFLSTWKLSSGNGLKVITVTGGTGQFAGATGYAVQACKVTADPASPFKFSCDCKGAGILVLPH
ncbi:MAG: hypothetical protein U0797_01620 [Gemmataceae bacterium]